MDKPTILNVIARQFIEEVESMGLDDNGDAQDLILGELLTEHGLDIDDDYDEAIEVISQQLKEKGA